MTFDFSSWVGEEGGDTKKELPVVRPNRDILPGKELMLVRPNRDILPGKELLLVRPYRDILPG